MDTEKHAVPRRKVNKRTFRKKASGKDVAKGFWVSFKIILKTAVMVAMIALCVAGGLLMGVVAGCIITTQPLTDEQLDIKNSTALTSFVYDAEGNEMAQIKGSANINRQLISIEEVPPYFAKAFVAIEDERFYTHKGVDIKRSGAAFLGYVIPGMNSHGGSTITQQVIKNLSGDDSQSVPRKIREQWRALNLEKRLDKDEIMELYMNVLYMGQDLYGIKTASMAYFNKEVKDLSLAECAFLAGITNNPARYNPLTLKGRANCYKRQVNILDKMLSLGFITDEQYIQAIQEDLKINDDYKKESAAASIYSYFTDAVIASVREAFMEQGYTKQEANNLIYSKGIKIYTTQDSQIQKIVDEEYCNPNNFPVNYLYSDPSDMAQSSIVIMDPYTGQVKALYGGYGEKKISLAFNFATNGKKQPGSAIKPLLVYGPLIDQHIITDSSRVVDDMVFLDDKNPDKPWPTNSYGYYRGELSVREALMVSSNVVAVKLYKDYVAQNLQYLKNLGMDYTEETQLSLALGGFKHGVSAMEMCAGYVPFANGGTYYKPILFTKVTDINGKVLLTNNGSPKVVYEDYRTTTIMTSMLQSVVTGGTGTAAQIYNGNGQFMPTAGKTGTTTSNYDYWFCGYTPYYTASVWYGYDMSKSMSASEKGAAAKLWNKVMTRIHADLAPKEFVQAG